MGFGHIGRYVYSLASKKQKFVVNAISDIGSPDILHYLLKNEIRDSCEVELENNYFISGGNKTRFVHGTAPGDIPWDALEVDWVIDATGKYLEREQLQKHIDSGADKVVLTSLPEEDLDRLVIVGVNEQVINQSDSLISAGSSTTNTLGLSIKILNDAFGIDYASMTTIHSYTGDQPAHDFAGKGFRRSRSAAENIIPNQNKSAYWVSKIIPKLQDRLMGSSLNVPVQFGSLLDLTCIFQNEGVTTQAVVDAMRKAEQDNPNLVTVVDDPIVSSDVIGKPQSVVFDSMGILKIGEKMMKMLIWYDNGFNQAARILDVISAYENMKN
jgi:glyceraldehyde 3-phosphate dehydrogenase